MFLPAGPDPRHWLFAILRNVIIDQTRARAACPVHAQAAQELVADDEIDAVILTWQLRKGCVG